MLPLDFPMRSNNNDLTRAFHVRYYVFSIIQYKIEQSIETVSVTSEYPHQCVVAKITASHVTEELRGARQLAPNRVRNV